MTQHCGTMEPTCRSKRIQGLEMHVSLGDSDSQRLPREWDASHSVFVHGMPADLAPDTKVRVVVSAHAAPATDTVALDGHCWVSALVPVSSSKGSLVSSMDRKCAVLVRT